METTLENTTPKSGWLHRLVSRLSVTWLTLRVGRALGRAAAHHSVIDRETWKKAMDAELEEAWAREEKLEAEIKHLKGELAYMKLQRDRLLEITWLDGPSEPWESTSQWQEQFNAGWVRRAVAANASNSATPARP